MIDFSQPIMVPVLGRGTRYQLLSPYPYTWYVDGRFLRLTVPAGVITDGASVPRILWSITGITPDGLHRPAALIHDWLYACRGIVTVHRRWDGSSVYEPVWTVWSREQADRLFARILREVGVGKFRRRLMYLGVRAGGWLPWQRTQPR